MSDMPATNVLAKVYQLYMVEYQCASILINHNQNKAAHTVFLKIYFLPLSTSGNGFSSSSRERALILYPNTIHKPMVRMVHITKKLAFRKTLLPFSILSCPGVSHV